MIIHTDNPLEIGFTIHGEVYDDDSERYIECSFKILSIKTRKDYLNFLELVGSNHNYSDLKHTGKYFYEVRIND